MGRYTLPPTPRPPVPQVTPPQFTPPPQEIALGTVRRGEAAAIMLSGEGGAGTDPMLVYQDGVVIAPAVEAETVVAETLQLDDGRHRLTIPYPDAPGLLHFDGFELKWLPLPDSPHALHSGHGWIPLPQTPSLVGPGGFVESAPIPPASEPSALQYDGSRYKWVPRFTRRK